MYEPVIGLEIHVQLKTKSKMFCGCSAHEMNAAPNTNVCPICLGNPGTLPVPNEQAIRFGVLMGLALNCAVAERSKFDRKNYFYPDLPKAYQISQFDLPINVGGFLEIEIPNGMRKHARIGMTRAHLEEDAAKSFHETDGKTYVDFNRGGTPLIEIVTEPDFASPQEAKIFLQELRLIARYLGISDADMEKGHLRCDANISLRKRDGNGNIVGAKFNPKTEIKNLNSFRHVERALEYEIERQTRVWEEEGAPQSVSMTRGWDEGRQRTIEQRSKEDSADYRYFPEPDIPALALAEIAEEMRVQMPELPAARRLRFQNEYALNSSDAKQICGDPTLADFAERVFSELSAWLDSTLGDETEGEAHEKQKAQMGRLVSGWLLSKLMGLMAARAIDIRTVKIIPENFAEFITLIATKKLNNAIGLKTLEAMLEDGNSPTHIMEEQMLGQMDDEGTLAEAVDRVIESHQVEVARYLAGEEQLLKFLIGQVMKETGSAADAVLTRNILLVKLKS
jgi:aspartyl-tRNA(Asn)/glutamyl-tRNA(Gln) amidotransferase subunit B